MVLVPKSHVESYTQSGPFSGGEPWLSLPQARQIVSPLVLTLISEVKKPYLHFKQMEGAALSLLHEVADPFLFLKHMWCTRLCVLMFARGSSGCG